MLIATDSVKFPWDVNAEQDIRHECLKRFGGADSALRRNNHPCSLAFFSSDIELKIIVLKKSVFRTNKDSSYASRKW